MHTLIGLHIYFDSKQEEFMSLLPTAGMKLIIHQSFDPIFPDTMGNTVSPGFNYIITVRRVFASIRYSYTIQMLLQQTPHY